MAEFEVISDMKPQGDQPAAIERLVSNYQRGQHTSVLLGVTVAVRTTATPGCAVEKLEVRTT